MLWNEVLSVFVQFATLGYFSILVLTYLHIRLGGGGTPEQRTVETLNAINTWISETEMRFQEKSEANANELIELVCTRKKLIKDMDLKLLELLHESRRR